MERAKIQAEVGCRLQSSYSPVSPSFLPSIHQWKKHVDFVKLERGEYWRRRGEGAEEGADVLSIIIDGQDQSATALPAYSEVKKKTQRAKSSGCK